MLGLGEAKSLAFAREGQMRSASFFEAMQDVRACAILIFLHFVVPEANRLEALLYEMCVA
jgi:hypothetical protein